MSFSICTSIRQLLEYFILSSDMQDTAPPSSSFTNLLPNFKTPLSIGQYLQQKARGRKHHALLSLPNTTTATITFNCSFGIFHNCKKQSPVPWPSPSNQWDWRESWNCSWGRGEQSRTYSQRSITVLVKGSNWIFANTIVHMASRLTGLVCF